MNKSRKVRRGTNAQKEPGKSAARYIMMLFVSVLILMLLSYFSSNRLNIQAGIAEETPFAGEINYPIQRTITHD